MMLFLLWMLIWTTLTTTRLTLLTKARVGSIELPSKKNEHTDTHTEWISELTRYGYNSDWRECGKNKEEEENEQWDHKEEYKCIMYYVVSLVQWVYKETRRGWHVIGEFFFVLFLFYGRVSGSHEVMFTDTPWGGRRGGMIT
jgi:hypothetical protein